MFFVYLFKVQFVLISHVLTRLKRRKTEIEQHNNLTHAQTKLILATKCSLSYQWKGAFNIYNISNCPELEETVNE